MSAGRPRLLPLAVAAAIVTAILLSLGTWQMQRRAWKEDLIATVRARTTAQPVPAPSLAEAARLDPLTFDYTAVRIEGRFLAGREARVVALVGAPHGRWSGPGHWAMTPLERADGSIVWINRGFVPQGREAEASPAPDGVVTIAGVARRTEPRGAFTPADEPARGVWFVRDPVALAAAQGLPLERVAPYTIDAGASATTPSGLPQAGETRVSFPNDHLGYALTWYGLAATCVGVFAAVAWGRRRER